MHPQQKLCQLEASDAEVVEPAVQGHLSPRVWMHFGEELLHQCEDDGGALVGRHRSAVGSGVFDLLANTRCESGGRFQIMVIWVALVHASQKAQRPGGVEASAGE
jgi:hypothetical protein